jgi:hypothetical protein
MDSAKNRKYGDQEESAHNGHLESAFYLPLLPFSREGDCLSARLLV